MSEETKKKPLLVTGNAHEPMSEIGKHLTRRRFEVSVRFEQWDHKDKKWVTGTRKTSAFSLADILHRKGVELSRFENNKNLKLLDYRISSVII